MTWTLAHIEQLKAKGSIRGFFDSKPRKKEMKIRERNKLSYEKMFIEAHLQSIWGNDLQKELKFCDDRKFRFDYSNKKLMIAVEYNGIISKKSRHTTITGYSKDMEKINLAQSIGYKVYQYTTLNYKKILNDIK